MKILNFKTSRTFYTFDDKTSKLVENTQVETYRLTYPFRRNIHGFNPGFHFTIHVHETEKTLKIIDDAWYITQQYQYIKTKFNNLVFLANIRIATISNNINML